MSSLNSIKEFNRKLYFQNATDENVIRKFAALPDIPDENKRILYENITAPLFTEELEDAYELLDEDEGNESLEPV